MNFTIGIGIAAILILLLWVVLLKNSNKKLIKIHDAALTCEELETHAREMAVEHVVSKKKNSDGWPIPRMNDNYYFIRSVYKELNEDVQNKHTVPTAAEWLLDNFYIIEEQVKSIRKDLTGEDYGRLPALKSGSLKGHARIYAIAAELVSHIDGQIDEGVLLKYINAYQSHSVLTDREIWAMGTMLRLAIIENIRYVCEKISDTQKHWRRADELLDSLKEFEALKEFEEDDDKLLKALESKIKTIHEFNPSFVEHLSFRLRRMGRKFSRLIGYVDERLARHGGAVDSITQKEHNAQAVNTVSIGNCIMSLKFLSNLDWTQIFQSSSHLEHILNGDPSGTYPLMDLASRSHYRTQIEELALAFNVSETHVANEIIALARNACASSENSNRVCHIGYYLVDKGVVKLEDKLGYKPQMLGRIACGAKNHPTPLYIGSIVFLTLALSALAGFYAALYHIALGVLAFVVSLIPSSDIAVTFVNWLACKIATPCTFSRLELKDGIPENLTTMVVIPALLPDEKRVKELLENLETHYLANKEKNIYFALAGDFKDAAEKKMPGDDKIVEVGLKGVSELNRKYSKDGRDIFYFLLRHRQFNKKQNKWMGWERKRGAIIEFNDVLLGSRTTSYTVSSNNALPENIKYVITLDADTILPIDGAKKMIGTMAHPLNTPVIDKDRNIVVDGYGLMQPRIGVEVESANKSLFSRIFTGQEGIDPYACAVSDVYQDLFSEGIFTGKGIYDLGVFQQVLKNALPDNAVLSHDLLEGSYIRAGLVTDLELIDSYPARYNSYAARLHRWVRGDWQLLPWLGSSVVDRKENRIKNPISRISKWKILDNLRRSIVSPALIILVTLGVSVLPGSALLWLAFSLLVIGFPLVTSVIDYLITPFSSAGKLKRHIPVISGLKASALQTAVMFTVLPYQAYLMAHAAVVSIVRVFVTKKNMLEWVTAADVEKGQKNSVRSYYTKMRISLFEAIIIAILSLVFKPDAFGVSLTLLVVWFASPWAAYSISKVTEEKPVKLSDEDVKELRIIARKTWRYFEEFINHKNHYIPPDNYQEDPPNGIAYRTSPTNIGLGLMCTLTARDLGYIGIYEMTDILSNTVSTMERLEKWNGHLYNWYDTRNLRPLIPRYISTVDSGNLVCYLITLVQGLNEYLSKPIVDVKFIDGIKDMAELVHREIDCTIEGVQFLGKDLNDLMVWSKTLDGLTSNKDGNTKKSRWKPKAEHMINMFKRELSNFMPWIELLKNAPEISGGLEATITALKSNVVLKDLPTVCKNALKSIDEAIERLKKSKHSETLSWLHSLRAAVEKSIEHTEKFIERYTKLMDRITAIADSTSFAPLYVEKKQLFSIGYNIEENRLTNSYYDLLASEARQTSYIAIARGEVPPKHWFKLGRALTVVDYYKGLVSWTGTIFEYLMPFLLMKSYKNTLLDETYSFVIRSQKKYGKQRNVPWGNSESAFYSMDINLDYQYKAIGVPWLGLKRGLIEDVVVSPYSTMLALPLDPAGAMENIKRLKAEGLDGAYGMYEAVDYTPERLPFGTKHAIVKSFMVHHQGMSLLALNNYLNDSIFQSRFHADPVVKAAQLLLQEKVPTDVVYTKEAKEKVAPFKDVVYKEKGSLRSYKQLDPVLPKVHMLSNGSYSVMVTDRGTGYSRNKSLTVTRWREDSLLDNYGMFFYIRNMDTCAAWSASYAPFGVLPEKYEVTFTADKAKFKRIDGDIETIYEIMVTSGDNAEIRRLSLKNRGESPCVLEVTSYFELVIAPQGADVAHPAFSSLFIKTEFLPEKGSILANRRPRAEIDRPVWIVNSAVVEGETVGGVEFETDRQQFIGRGRTVSSPVAMEHCRPLSNTSGAVLDPVMSLRHRIKIQPGQVVKLSHITAVSESRESVIELMEKYSTPESVESAFKLALTRSQVETRYLNISAEDAESYQDMMSHILFISPLKRLKNNLLAPVGKGQSSLWSYGISGDLPIMLVVLKKSDELDIVYEALKAHEYWRIKDLKVDMVILNDEENSYTHPLRTILSDVVVSSHARDILNKSSGVFILSCSNMPDEDIALLYACSRIILKGDGGSLSKQVQGVPNNQLPPLKHFTGKAEAYVDTVLKFPELQYFNGLGGFTADGKEYVIRLEKNQNTPLPWVNVIANPNFGFIVTESGGGYTWSENSRENKLTPWSNDPVSDTQGEVFYVSDNDSGELWTLTPLPIREDSAYIITHGLGYSIFQHASHGLEHEMMQFVPVDESVKISTVKIKNVSGTQRSLNITYYIHPVLGVNEQFTSAHIKTSVNEQGALLIENPYNEEFPRRIAFVDSSIKERSVTGDRKEFLGIGKMNSPDALNRQSLSGTVGTDFEPCAALQVNFTLKSGEEKEINFLLGMVKQPQEVIKLTGKYRNVIESKKALAHIKKWWEEKLGAVQVSTPDMSMDFMLNGWLLYQTIVCRLWSRSAFYQSGGAYGFRDQLQDSLSAAHIYPEIARNQILLHARHQFTEGDVQHWWHEPDGKGTRTKFSDDLLWLPYVTAEYIRITGDSGILHNDIPFLYDEPLKEFEDERYSKPNVSGEHSTLYNHCIRAIERALKFGEHGLPLMGSGDWNDGMSAVGNRGKGESVWLAWFLYSVLMKFAPICNSMGEEERGQKYTEIAKNIVESIEKNAWDGGWYRRAYFDNGVPLGSVQNSECKIDSISQSWAVISGAGDSTRASAAMNSLEHYLIMRDEGLIKLLTPPFDESDLEPGYIKGYVPGVRENGGQYTHAAAWVIIAFAMLGDGDRAWEFFELINPINHTRTHMEYSKYKVEPYVMAADVYAVPPHTGRGGWTWYTGSSGWMYRAGLEYILGLKKNGDSLIIDPCVPRKWKEYSMRYKYGGAVYEIKVKNPDGVNKGVRSVSVDGVSVDVVRLVDDGKVHVVEAVMG